MFAKSADNPYICIQLRTSNLHTMEKDIYKELEMVESVNIYRLYWENGVHTIKILGYLYKSDDNGEGEWRHLEFCWYDMPVDTYLTGGADAWDIWESECKQYIGDCTAEEAYEIWKGYNATILNVYDITDETPDGVYLDGTSVKYQLNK